MKGNNFTTEQLEVFWQLW